MLHSGALTHQQLEADDRPHNKYETKEVIPPGHIVFSSFNLISNLLVVSCRLIDLLAVRDQSSGDTVGPWWVWVRLYYKFFL